MTPFFSTPLNESIKVVAVKRQCSSGLQCSRRGRARGLVEQCHFPEKGSFLQNSQARCTGLAANFYRYFPIENQEESCPRLSLLKNRFIDVICALKHDVGKTLELTIRKVIEKRQRLQGLNAIKFG